MEYCAAVRTEACAFVMTGFVAGAAAAGAADETPRTVRPNGFRAPWTSRLTGRAADSGIDGAKNAGKIESSHILVSFVKEGAVAICVGIDCQFFGLKPPSLDGKRL